MRSNTGFASATELLMTCSTSAVAVCRSSASFVSRNIFAFWIAITAWSAKVFSSASSFGVKPPSSARCSRMVSQSRRPRSAEG